MRFWFALADVLHRIDLAIDLPIANDWAMFAAGRGYDAEREP